ncbi:DUF4867 family protein [Oscillospiraceae bacterium PP1C4]
MKVYSVSDGEFSRYGRILNGFNCAELIWGLQKTPLPDDGIVYVASDPELEQLDIFAELQNSEFGGMPIELGYCNGVNHKLNALEYHRSSEINISADDFVLLLGSLHDVDSNRYTYDTSFVQAFLVPAGTMVELYATTLHFAPCSVQNQGFRDAVVLPRGTNLPLTVAPKKENEAKLLFAVNKWLIAHSDSGLDKDGAFIGLTGKNITLE